MLRATFRLMVALTAAWFQKRAVEQPVQLKSVISSPETDNYVTLYSASRKAKPDGGFVAVRLVAIVPSTPEIFSPRTGIQETINCRLTTSASLDTTPVEAFRR